MPLSGKSRLYNHFAGAKALFYYAKLQVSNSVGGGAKSCRIFHLGALLFVPPCKYVPERN